MNTPHILALIIVAIGLVLLLVQTARAAYWKGTAEGRDAKNENLIEAVNHAREMCEDAQKETRQLREYLQRLHERALLASSEPELFNELMEANDLLRSFRAIVKREGADTNWDGLDDRLSERLERQHAMLYAAPVVA